MKTVTGTHVIQRFGMDHLRSVAVFGALSPEGIEFLLHSGRVLQLDKGDVIYEPGDKGDRFYVVLQGALSFYKYHLGEFAYIRDHGFGEEMGFVAMIALHDRVGKAVAAEEGCVLEVSCGLFHELHEKRPADFGLLLLNLSREMARTITEVNNLIVEHEIAKRTSA